MVNKQWAITDTTSGVTTTYANGTQPSRPAGRPDPRRHAPAVRASARTGFAQGDTVAIAETVTNGLRGCVLGTPTIGEPTASRRHNVGVPYTATLAGGTNSFLITNPVTCTTRLTLVKTVQQRPGRADRLEPQRHRPGRRGRRAGGHHRRQRRW